MNTIRESLAAKLPTTLYPDSSVAHSMHLAVLNEPYLTHILEGRKTIESRFGVHKSMPYDRVVAGDIIFLKRAAGFVVGACVVDYAISMVLTPYAWEVVRAYADFICIDEVFIQSQQHKKYVTLICLRDVTKITPFPVDKRDRRAWVKMEGGYR